MEKKYKILIGFSVLIVTGFLIYAVVVFIHYRNSNPLKEFQRVNENLERINDSIDQAYGLHKLDENLIQRLSSKSRSVLSQFYKVDSLAISLKDTIEIIKHWAIDSLSSSNMEIDKGFVSDGAKKLRVRFENYISEYNKFRAILGLNDTMSNYFKVDEDENGVQLTWEQYNFYHLPLAGFITNLSVLQSDIVNSKNKMVSDLEQYAKK